MNGLVEIHDHTSLEQFRITWDELWHQTSSKSFCSSYAWFSAYAHHFLPENSLRVMVVSVNGKTLGIVPLVIRPVQTRVGTLRMLTYPYCRWGSIDRPIGPHPTATIMLALRHLQRSPADWDFIDLREIRDTGGNHSRLSNSMRQAGLAFRQRNWESLSTVNCDTDWWEYWANRPASLKEHAAAMYRNVSRQGEIELIRQRDATPQSQVRSRQHESSMGRRQNPISGIDLWTQFEAIADLPHKDLAFLREIHPKASQLGMADLTVLRVDGKPVAAGYGFQSAGDVLNYWLSDGIGPTKSVRTLLTEMLLQDSFARGDRQVLLRGDEYPERVDWETDHIQSGRFTHFSTTSPRAQALRFNQFIRRFSRNEEQTSAERNSQPKSDLGQFPRLHVAG